MDIKSITPVGRFKIVHVRGEIEGVKTCKPFAPGSDISNEPQEVQDVCNAAWTDDVVRAYEAHKAEQL